MNRREFTKAAVAVWGAVTAGLVGRRVGSNPTPSDVAASTPATPDAVLTTTKTTPIWIDTEQDAAVWATWEVFKHHRTLKGLAFSGDLAKAPERNGWYGRIGGQRFMFHLGRARSLMARQQATYVIGKAYYAEYGY